MAHEIDPKETNRAAAFELWMKAPNPMVTLMKTMDVTNLVRVGRKGSFKIQMCLSMAGAAFARYASTHFYAFSTLCRKMRGNQAFFGVGVSPGIRNKINRNGCDFAVFAL
ncbi:MAG: hypothetical protein K5982_06665 [Selenomonadaceae bacterium]|nr:hypothetical protein [Selenomonadaceae bacterium]